MIGEASTAPEVLAEAGAQPWDLIVLDLTMPGRSGLDSLHELKAAHPNIPILVLSMHPEDQFAVRTLRAGASGYLTKESVPDEMILAVKMILAGRKYIRPSIADLLASHLQESDANQPPHSKLSDREFQVMISLAKGRTVTIIAEDLCLSVKSISTYRARILEKLHIKSTADLVRYAIQHRLIE
jgi:DNA-binding NarL/FixJ family response regulator